MTEKRINPVGGFGLRWTRHYGPPVKFVIFHTCHPIFAPTQNYYELQPIYLSTLAGEPLHKTSQHAPIVRLRERIGLSLDDTL